MTASASGMPIASFDTHALMASLRARIGLQTTPTVTEVEKGAIARFDYEAALEQLVRIAALRNIALDTPILHKFTEQIKEL